MPKNHSVDRRQALGTMAAVSAAIITSPVKATLAEQHFYLSTFKADVTPPLGHPLLAGWRKPALTILDRLSVKGVVLLGGEKPIVLASIDWCELRNDSYDRWRSELAKAAGTTRDRVLLSSNHQHDAPYADLEAQRLMDQHGLKKSMFDPKFHEICVQRTAGALAESLKSKQRITHFGIGQAKVEKVACNRRVELPGRPIHFNRGSYTRDPVIRNAPDGVIDPMLKTLSFFNGDQPLAALNTYATHPMSYYGRGEVSSDFVGMARQMRQRDDASIFQMYVTGCSGDITASKYNDGDFAGRVALAERLHQGMKDAWQATKRIALTQIGFHCEPLRLKPESGGQLSVEALQKILANPKATQRARSHAALGLSWHRRCAAGQAIDLPVIDFGAAKYVLLPAESFVAYQLAAQKMRPDLFVLTAGFGECAPGYISTAQTRKEGVVRELGYCWTAAGTEATILSTLEKALTAKH